VVGNVLTGSLGETAVAGTINPNTSRATVSGNTITIDGKTVTVSSLPALIKDDAGTIFQVKADGTVTKVATYDTALATAQDPDMKDGSVIFTANKDASYAFDAWQSKFNGVIQLEREYELIGAGYRVPAKLILPGEVDAVDANLQNSSYNTSHIKFANGQGAVFNHTVKNGKFTIKLAGGPAGDGQHIYAWYVNGNDKKVIGKLLLASYAPQQKQVVVIPVKKSTYSASDYAEGLNKAYAKLGINYTVTLDNSFINNRTWDLDGNGKVQYSGSKLLSTDYKGEEAAMIQAYADFKGGVDKLDPQTAYFFEVYEASNLEDNLLGKMPAEEQFGFLYTGGATRSGMANTIAHEIGHGAYHMEHSFHNLYLKEGSKTTTQNLMDYAGGYELWKYQWDIIHDPGHVWGVLKRDRDGEMVGSKGNV